jgi:hypothetical protein
MLCRLGRITPYVLGIKPCPVIRLFSLPVPGNYGHITAKNQVWGRLIRSGSGIAHFPTNSGRTRDKSQKGLFFRQAKSPDLIEKTRALFEGR